MRSKCFTQQRSRNGFIKIDRGAIGEKSSRDGWCKYSDQDEEFMPEAIQSPEDLSAYVEQLSILLDLPLQSEHRRGVLENLYRTQAVARLFLEFPLPDTVEAAFVFQP